MNCKHCNAQLPEDSIFCPICGKEQEKVSAEVIEETAVIENSVAGETAATETVTAEKAVVDGAKSVAMKSSKGLWISGSLLLGFQILISSGSASTGYLPFTDVTNWRVMLYDLVFFLSSNFLGVIGFILLVVAAIRTFGAKSTVAPDTTVEGTVPAEETAAEEAAEPAAEEPAAEPETEPETEEVVIETPAETSPAAEEVVETPIQTAPQTFDAAVIALFAAAAAMGGAMVSRKRN